MALVEINFDGIVGPSHNYAGLSLGNLAATANAGSVAYPRAAALQGIAKMRHNLALGLAQGIFAAACPGPNHAWLTELGTTAPSASTHSAPAACLGLGDVGGQCRDGLARPRHRRRPLPPDRRQSRAPCRTAATNGRRRWRSSASPSPTASISRCIAPVPPPFGDEGAANHMRLAPSHGAPGVEIFVYGERGGPFPARQHAEASRAVARLHRLDPERTLFVRPVRAAIAAGAFHNDVVAVANEHVLFAHEQAFADSRTLLRRPARAVARGRDRRGARRARSASPTRSSPICSTPSW